MEKSRVKKVILKDEKSYNYTYLILALVVFLIIVFLIFHFSKSKVLPAPGDTYQGSFSSATVENHNNCQIWLFREENISIPVGSNYLTVILNGNADDPGSETYKRGDLTINVTLETGQSCKVTNTFVAPNQNPISATCTLLTPLTQQTARARFYFKRTDGDCYTKIVSTVSYSGIIGSYCGDGSANGEEQCDGSDFGSTTCQSLGFNGGTLSCNSSCRAITSACTLCGNNVKDSGEACDGTNLSGQTCITKGFNTGTLRCNSTCGFDASNCSNAPLVSCGNGIVEGTEVCDGTNLTGKTCQTEMGLNGIISCTSSCTLNTSLCASCGNNNTEGNEVCDGSDLNSNSCQSLGYTGGTLSCKADCTDYNKTRCSNTACGNGIVEGTEVCDGTNLTGKNCTYFGFTNGTLSCNSSCGFVTSACNNLTRVCGNGIVEGTEVCDGTNLTGKTCQSLGFTNGTLSCYSNCTLNSSKCTSTTPCNASCTSLGFDCGTHSICNNVTNCGGCASGKECTSAGRCIDIEIPCDETCSGLGYECGVHAVCGGNENCGTCADNEECDAAGQCIKQSSSWWIWVLVIFVLAGGIAGAYLFMKKRKGGFEGGLERSKPQIPPVGPNPSPPMFKAPSQQPSTFNPKFDFEPRSPAKEDFGFE